MNWSKVGSDIRSMFESVFKGVAPSTVTCVYPDGSRYELQAVVSIEVLRQFRDTYSVDSAGIQPMESLRFCFLTTDIVAKTGSKTLNPSCYFLYDGNRYDFAVKFTGSESEYTPFIGAVDIFTVCFVRRAMELEETTEAGATDPPFKIGNW